MHGVVLVALRHHLKDVGDAALFEHCFPGQETYLAIAEYPDDAVLGIASRIAARLPGVSCSEVLRSLGEGVPSALKRIAPTVLPRARSLDDLVEQLDKGGFGGARRVVPRFRVADREERRVRLVHRGNPALCRFDEGLLTGFIELIGENVALRHPSCRQRRDAECEFLLRPLKNDARGMRRSSGMKRITTRPFDDKG